MQALRARLAFYSEEFRRGHPPLANSAVIAPLINAVTTVDMAEAYDENYEVLIEGAISVQEAALAIERLVRVVESVNVQVELETRNRDELLSYGKAHNIGMKSHPADLDMIKSAYLTN